jgi:esterase/lipase superfamily enzyme
MNREYHKWFSPILNREMELLLFGHHGAPVIVFPTSMGSFHQYEDFGMVGALEEHLNQGWIQLVCISSVDAESWYNKTAYPAQRVVRHVEYENYILNEVVPFVRHRNENPFWMATGCSFGAYHAVNFGLRHPALIRRSIGLSGLYDLSGFMDGHYDENFYFNNPVDYTANIHDARQISHLKQQDIIMAAGREDTNFWSNEKVSGNLWRAGIGNALRAWDGWAHDWPWWQNQIRMYIGGHD